MKTAIYIEDGLVQLVITPESEWEKNALRSFEAPGGKLHAEFFVGSFYDCRGGWTRQKGYYPSIYDSDRNNDDRSLILRTQPQTIPACDGPTSCLTQPGDST